MKLKFPTWYKMDQTSHRQPGYWLANQVPPILDPFSKILKGIPAFFNLIPMQRPENPAPTMQTLAF